MVEGMQDTRLLESFQLHQADVEMFQTQRDFYEYNLVKKSISNTSCFTFFKSYYYWWRQHFNMYGYDFRHPSIWTKYQTGNFFTNILTGEHSHLTIVKRSLINVMSVASSFVTNRNFHVIREFIWCLVHHTLQNVVKAEGRVPFFIHPVIFVLLSKNKTKKQLAFFYLKM